MRKNFGSKPACYPMPVYIIGTYGADGTPNAMNAAWGGISEEEEISLCISAGHKTTANILEKKAFTVSMATADQIAACDYVGIVSGNKVPDKFAKAGFHAEKSAFVDAPIILELPLALDRERFRRRVRPGREWQGGPRQAEAHHLRSPEQCLPGAGRKGRKRIPGRRCPQIKIQEGYYAL